MKVDKLPFDQVQRFAPIFLDYLADDPALRDFYHHRPTIEGFGDLLKERKLDTATRKVLADVLTEQYQAVEPYERVQQNIDRLRQNNTFTITTGHQLNLFTGPLYFIFKIVTVINACRQLRQAHPDYQFVPVYWMATEDHDFEEINHFHLFGKKHTWESNQTGPVGRFKTAGMDVFLKSIAEPIDVFRKAYTENETLAGACRQYVNELFGEEGLIVIDADDHRLKSLFAPIMESDIRGQKAHQLVAATNQGLIDAGYKSQAFSREINFFYIQDGLRERIEQKGDLFAVKNTDLNWSEDELVQKISEHPECFSPNVIMRPLYQETILPNLGYVGGPAEMAYWLQLGEVFKHYETSFPILLPRNFGVVIDHVAARKIEKVGLDNPSLFKDAHELKERMLLQIGDDHLLDDDREALQGVFEKIREKAVKIDGSLDGYVGAQGTHVLKTLENVQRKLRRAKENKNDIAMNQIDDIKERLFPNGGLQERFENFLTFQIHNPNFTSDLLVDFDPFDLKFHLLWQE
ncbi:MAG: bacillithiol biosynthesis cysteine-adding enzyme BshC [Bacteroidota bacterium]